MQRVMTRLFPKPFQKQSAPGIIPFIQLTDSFVRCVVQAAFQRKSVIRDSDIPSLSSLKVAPYLFNEGFLISYKYSAMTKYLGITFYSYKNSISAFPVNKLMHVGTIGNLCQEISVTMCC